MIGEVATFAFSASSLKLPANMENVAQGQITILWMDGILHRFETMRNHDLLVVAGAIIIPGFLRWCEMDFVPPQYISHAGGFSFCGSFDFLQDAESLEAFQAWLQPRLEAAAQFSREKVRPAERRVAFK